MNIAIQSSIHTLKKSLVLLDTLTDDILSDNSVSPYYSCIGSHIRHILDFYDCILQGLPLLKVDLTLRKRDLKMHSCCEYASQNVSRVINTLESQQHTGLDSEVEVFDDLGLGKTRLPYTFGALLAQANSHAIHHYAIINYILDRLGISIEDETFGFNPTTPRPNISMN